jgi:hypothetical protein
VSTYPLAVWQAGISSALREQDIPAVVSLLAAMAADGYADEADELRRQMLAVTTDEEHR